MDKDNLTVLREEEDGAVGSECTGVAAGTGHTQSLKAITAKPVRDALCAIASSTQGSCIQISEERGTLHCCRALDGSCWSGCSP